MSKTLNFQKTLIIFGIPFLIIGFMVLLAKSASFTNNLAIGITIDLILTIPIIYFLLIRNTNIPKTTVVPFFILGIIICSLILPAGHQFYLNLFKTYLLPVVEISVFAFVIFKVRKGVIQYRMNKIDDGDFFTILKSTCYKFLPKSAVMPVATEIAVFYYGFIYWKKRNLKVNEFSYHRESGAVALMLVTIFIIAIETYVLHILLSKWSEMAAWLLTFLSVYSGIQIFGFLKSIIKRPIFIMNSQLHLRYGIIKETIINISEIDSLEMSSKEFDPNEETQKLSFLGELESHNIIIRLKTENEIIGLYGGTKKYKTIALHVDDKIEFTTQINRQLIK